MEINSQHEPGLGHSQESDPNFEAYRARSNYEMDEERSRMDPEFQRLINAESARDIAPLLESLRRENDTDLMEAVDRYGNTRALATALKRSSIFAKGHAYLIDPNQLIVVNRNDRKKPGTIDSNTGFVGGDSVPRVSGYSLFVDVKMKDVPYIETISTPDGPLEITKYHQVRVENVNYGTELHRQNLSKAFLEFAKQGIVTDQIFNHANLLWNSRAALELMVKTIYTKEIYKSNAQIGWFFSAPDIAEMHNNPDNKIVGERRDLATRLLELVGYCETKEKLEGILNSTFILESILDEATQDRVIMYMKETGVLIDKKIEETKKEEAGQEEQKKAVERYEAVVEFLLGKNITITADKKGTKQYKLGKGWLTKDERDPSKTNVEGEKKKRGKKAIKEEQDVRGWLTEFGNPYTGHVPQDRDNMSALLARMSIIVGDSLSTTEAHRNFYWWGEPDWLGAEIYAPDAIPNGETLAQKRSELRGQDWIKYATEISSYFSTGGEPVGTDLIKIMWPNLYRLKDFVAGQGRPTGQYVTIGGIDHLAQSFFGLIRSEITVNGKARMRNLREQWLGSKDETLGEEVWRKLGDFEWTKIGGDIEMLIEFISEKVTTIEENTSALPDSTKKIVQKLSDAERSKLIFNVNRLVTAKLEAIGAGAEGFYWLMNFLVADENEVKRMWAALNAELKPETLTSTNGFTGKIKFMDITQNAQGPYDGYIAAEKRALANNRELSDQVSVETKQRARDYLRKWYEGVKGDPSYRMWAAKPIERIKLTGGNNIEQTTNGEYVDSLAELYDFIDKNRVRLPLKEYPALRVDIA